MDKMDKNGLRKTVESLLSKVPKEVKESAPYIFTATAQVFDAAALHDAISPVNNVLDYLKPGRVCSPETAQSLIQQANNNSGVASHSESLVTYMTSKAEVPKAIKDSITDGMKSAANMFLITSAICAGVQLLVSLSCLWNLYESVKDARNLAESSKGTLALISGKLKSIQGMMSEVDNILKELSQPDIVTQHWTITRITSNMCLVKTKIDCQLRACIRQLDSLEFEIQKKKVKLGDARRHAFVAGVTSGIHCVTSAFSVVALIGTASPICLWITGVFSAVNLVLGVACPVYALITRKDLDELSTRLDDISKVKASVEDMEIELRSQAELIFERIKELMKAAESEN